MWTIMKLNVVSNFMHHWLNPDLCYTSSCTMLLFGVAYWYGFCSWLCTLTFGQPFP